MASLCEFPKGMASLCEGPTGKQIAMGDHMARKHLIRTSVLPYHVYARTNNREWLFAKPEIAWEIFIRLLNIVTQDYGARIHGFVMMANHFHLILSTPLSNLDRIMQYLLRETTKSMNRVSGRINHLFGGPYKWSLISEAGQYPHIVKYMYRNPVKAGITQSVEDYSWSTVTQQLNPKRDAQIPLHKSIFELPPRIGSRATNLDWLNIAYSAEEDDCVRRGLKRREFKFSPDRISKRMPAIFAK